MVEITAAPSPPPPPADTKRSSDAVRRSEEGCLNVEEIKGRNCSVLVCPNVCERERERERDRLLQGHYVTVFSFKPKSNSF